MKNKYLLPWLALCVAFAAPLLVACSEDDPPAQVEPADAIVIAPEQAVQGVADNTTLLTVVFSTTAAWTATLDGGDGWGSVDALRGDAGDVVMTLRLKANATSQARVATISIVAGAATQTVSITQAAPVDYADGGREDIMLQGFYWDSQKVTGWTQLMNYADDIAASFSCVWLPPSASAEGGNAVGGNNVGYHPRVWNDQNSCWGTAENLKKLIAALHDGGVKVIADVVVNHRAGYTGWGNFPPDDFGEYGVFQLDTSHICSDDEMNDPIQCADTAWLGKAAGAADTGENWGGARDLDHTSAIVRQDIEAYLNWLRGEFGYDGWRYDFCKGYDGRYVATYNDATSPYISVGELWDGSYDVVNSWLKAAGYKSMAFDFPSKYDALNNGLAKRNFGKMTWLNQDDKVNRPAGLIHHSGTDSCAVTFVDNHDTYRDGSKYTGDVNQAYAFILSSPGVPCVFWLHWQDKLYKRNIEAMIAARKSVGLTNVSDVRVTQSSTYYEAVATGRRGSLVCRIGAKAPSAAPDGYELACNGSGWAFFVKR